MKRLVGCILLVAALVSLSVYSKLFSQGKMAEIQQLVQSAEDCYTGKEYDEAAKCARKAKEMWSSLAEDTLFVDCPEIDVEITITLARIEEYVQYQDDEVYPECAAAMNLLDNYSDRQSLTWVNIF